MAKRNRPLFPPGVANMSDIADAIRNYSIETGRTKAEDYDLLKPKKNLPPETPKDPE